MAQIVRQDFILNENGDFPLQDTVVNGVWLDTPYGDSDQQHITDIVFYNLGWLKQFPTLGVGISQYLNSEFNLSDISKVSKLQLLSDEYIMFTGFVFPATGGGFYINTQYAQRQ